MRATTLRFTLLMIATLVVSSVASANGLEPQTLKAWNDYIQAVNTQMQQRASGATSFMWLDEAPGRREAVRRGETVVQPAREDGVIKVPHGLIYDWVGAVFMPNATVHGVFKVLNEFDRYDQFYDPTVTNVKVIQNAGNSQIFSMVLVDKTPIGITAMEAEYNSHSSCVDQKRCYGTIYSTRIQQIVGYGGSGEHKLPPDQGYLWRLYSVQRFEERDGGVYAEFEAIALSRDVPIELRWLIKPILEHVPRNSMVGTLEKTRTAVCTTEKTSPRPKDEAAKVHHSVAASEPRLNNAQASLR